MTSQTTVFITGAARGIGRATAETFLRHGWTVGVSDVDVDALATGWEHVTDLRTGRPRRPVVTTRLDVTDRSGWDRALDEFVAVAGSLTVLVNNAGTIVSGPFEELSWESQSRLVDINVKGVLAGSQAAFNHLRVAGARGGGGKGAVGAEREPARIVTMCSASAFYGQSGIVTYAATKSAVQSITEGLDLEWLRFGIRAFCVSPLWVRTALVDDAQAAGSVSALGVRLSTETIAAAVYRQATQPSRVLGVPRGVNRVVGVQTRALYHAGRLVPQVVARAVASRLGR
ncbi:SDR family NAD(P)-dependent oxidoreductase [Sanguibacter antarcticus]|uniref:Short-subunit dehydrogenase n=1 Tax=Sanguibacter antarcticus TaxID=372484 RepID=A0A2A9E6E0_9MICO|nr:SDR family NAD(P)-dependent oxidoreductase [Sanguibacter antarcticus]PFG34528.1 short-subunit dehydrogenase [Sanguibacter antarcticus]